MRILLLIPVALFMWGCTADPLPVQPPADSAAPTPAAAAKVVLPPLLGEASLDFWEAMDAFMAAGRTFLPTDLEHDENDRGRTFLDYLPRHHPWFEQTDRFCYEVWSSRPTSYTLRENLDPDDVYGNSLALTVDASTWQWDSPYTPPGWSSFYGTRGELNARFKQTVHSALKIARTMHRFRAGTTEFWGYPTLAADIYLHYPNDAGRTFSDLFPGALPFANAYTGLVTEPQWEESAGSVGVVGVMGIIDAYGLPDGFSITARGYVNMEFLKVNYRSVIVDPPWDDGPGHATGRNGRTSEPSIH